MIKNSKGINKMECQWKNEPLRKNITNKKSHLKCHRYDKSKISTRKLSKYNFDLIKFILW